jgi:hypothetical protein
MVSAAVTTAAILALCRFLMSLPHYARPAGDGVEVARPTQWLGSGDTFFGFRVKVVTLSDSYI